MQINKHNAAWTQSKAQKNHMIISKFKILSISKETRNRKNVAT
jgi:hypothetical protein